jgi:hypothetical protein
MSVNRKRHNSIVLATSPARYQDMKYLIYCWPQDRPMSMATSFLIGVAWIGKGARCAGLILYAVRIIIVVSVRFPRSGRAVMRPSCPPRRSNERTHGHPRNHPLQHVTWRTAVSLRAISFGLMALGGSSSLPSGGQKRPKTLVGSAHSMATFEMANRPWTTGHPFFHPPLFLP